MIRPGSRVNSPAPIEATKKGTHVLAVRFEIAGPRGART